jgi:nucleoside 2-deoxyribosyltransferase
MTSALKVYVAGGSVERAERTVPMIRALRQEGIEITWDWTIVMDKHTAAPYSDDQVPESVRRRCTELDINGVRQADFLLLLAPNQRGSSGAWVELGLAIAWGLPIIVCGPGNRRSIFTSRAYQLFETDEEGLEFLVQVHREKGSA